MAGGGKGGKQEVIQTTKNDPQTQAYLDQLRGYAGNVGRAGLGMYANGQGPAPAAIPGMTATGGEGLSRIRGLGDLGEGWDQAQSQYLDAGQNLGLGSGILQRAGQGDVSAFYNPYQQQVIDASSADFDRQRQGATMQANDLATKAGAFGGSRSAVLQANALDNVNRDESSTLANLRNAGYGQSFDRAMQSGQSLANLGMGALNNYSSGQLAQEQAQSNAGQQQLAAGEYQRALKERQLRQPYNDAVNSLGIMGPYVVGGGQTTMGPSQSSNPLMSGLGGAASGFAVGGPIGAGIGGGLGLLSSFF